MVKNVKYARTYLLHAIKEKYGSISNFAKASGIHRNTISSILHGTNGTASVWLKIMQTLNVSFDDFSEYFIKDRDKGVILRHEAHEDD